MNNLINEVPKENITAYRLILKIEVGLRELIIQSLEIIDPLWW